MTINVVTVEVPNAAALYTTGDVIGGLLTFNVGVHSGIIEQVIVGDDDQQDLADKLYLYDTQPTTIADNAAFAVTNAERNTIIGKVDLAAYDTITDESYNNVSIPFYAKSSRLYGYLVSAGGGTYTGANAITIRLSISY